MIWHFTALNGEGEGDSGVEEGLSKSFELIAPHVWVESLKKGLNFEAAVSLT